MAAGQVGHANRGRALELAVEQANAQYHSYGIARVQKVAVPTKLVKSGRWDDPAKLVREKSTVDYIGVWQGRAVAFDAKENRKEARFPLASVQGHQIGFLDSWDRAGGIAFLLIWHEPDQAAYVLPYAVLWPWWRAWAEATGRASIPVDELRRLPRARAGRGCTVDYLAALDTWIRSAPSS